jgi:hypothetical protein
VELAMVAGDQFEGLDMVSGSGQRLARHPGGPERVSSVVAVLDLDVQLALRHRSLPVNNMHR